MNQLLLLILGIFLSVIGIVNISGNIARYTPITAET